eukprot:Gregarina_sp_Poly_1__9287@NODE_575_length_7472_cov_59_507225_g449_i0_p3_GENE_NODE_575_length_7472_cov_59_507225_g449_i0NODE_575_length_7472_cov_59_507225_g449_i0_p3_ORF_typecomplete_len288_score24_01_NODE_575_length_7472_cov_59_507225_g449_i063977260
MRRYHVCSGIESPLELNIVCIFHCWVSIGLVRKLNAMVTYSSLTLAFSICGCLLLATATDKPPVLAPVLPSVEVLAFYELLQKVAALDYGIQADVNSHAPQEFQIADHRSSDIGDSLYPIVFVGNNWTSDTHSVGQNSPSVTRPPLISVISDAIRGLFTLQSTFVDSAFKHSHFLMKNGQATSQIQELDEMPKMRSLRENERAAKEDLESQVEGAATTSVLLSLMPDMNDVRDSPFSHLTQNAIEVLLDSIQTNARFWAVPVQQAGLLVQDIFTGLAEVTRQINPTE